MINKYIIDLNYVIIAWRKYKPKISSEDSVFQFEIEREMKSKKPQNSSKNNKFRTIVGKKFLKDLKKSLQRNKLGEEIENQETVSRIDLDDIDDNGSEITNFDENLQIIKNYLWRFKLSSDTGITEEINLFHVIRAIPKRINTVNISKIDLINFSLVQKSIIGFQNDDQDELFKYYDKRNRNRMNEIKLSGETNLIQLNHICGDALRVFEKLKLNYGISTYQQNDESESFIGYDQKSDSDI